MPQATPFYVPYSNTVFRICKGDFGFFFENFKLGAIELLGSAGLRVLPSHPPTAGAPPEGEPPRKLGHEAVRGQTTQAKRKQTARQNPIYPSNRSPISLRS